MERSKFNAWKNSAAYKAGLVKARTRQLVSARKIAESTKSTPEERASARNILDEAGE